MGRNVCEAFRKVVGTSNDLSAGYDNCADGNLAHRCRMTGFRQGLLHEKRIIHYVAILRCKDNNQEPIEQEKRTLMHKNPKKGGLFG